MHNTSEASLIRRAPSGAVNGASESALIEAFFFCYREHNPAASVKACGQTQSDTTGGRVRTRLACDPQR